MPQKHDRARSFPKPYACAADYCCKLVQKSVLQVIKMWHAGILNLMTLVLLATNARLILENLLKYGILTNPTRWFLFLIPDGTHPLATSSIDHLRFFFSSRYL